MVRAYGAHNPSTEKFTDWDVPYHRRHESCVSRPRAPDDKENDQTTDLSVRLRDFMIVS
jgi:hypothetical protein